MILYVRTQYRNRVYFMFYDTVVPSVLSCQYETVKRSGENVSSFTLRKSPA